jgi:hypothetical protein
MQKQEKKIIYSICKKKTWSSKHSNKNNKNNKRELNKMVMVKLMRTETDSSQQKMPVRHRIHQLNLRKRYSHKSSNSPINIKLTKTGIQIIGIYSGLIQACHQSF